MEMATIAYISIQAILSILGIGGVGGWLLPIAHLSRVVVTFGTERKKWKYYLWGKTSVRNNNNQEELEIFTCCCQHLKSQMTETRLATWYQPAFFSILFLESTTFCAVHSNHKTGKMNEGTTAWCPTCTFTPAEAEAVAPSRGTWWIGWGELYSFVSFVQCAVSSYELRVHMQNVKISD